MRKHIIITKLFEFGGSNTHLKTLIKYFGEDNIILLLEDESQLSYLKNIDAQGIHVKINAKLCAYAHLRYRFTTNVKEFISIIRSILAIQFLSLKYGFADITINTVEPEKYLYLLWVPFSKVVYILHTTPNKKYTSFTSFTCRVKLGKRKKIITVSNSNKNLICENWNIPDNKRPFVCVIYNCIVEKELNNKNTYREKNNKQYIVTLGHVIAYKNPHVWLEVAKLVTSVREHINFIWLGNGPLLENCKALTQETKRIAFEGLVTNPHTYLKNALMYYQPSLFETHGIATVEAMSNYLPCIVSNVGGLPESIQHEYNGLLVHPEDVDEQANFIIRLIDNTELRLKYGVNAHKKYEEFFSFNIFTSKMNAAYNIHMRESR